MYKSTVPQRYVQHGPKNRPGFFSFKRKVRHLSPFKRNHCSCISVGWYTLDHQADITCSSANTVYVIMCEVHNKLYIGFTTDLKAHWKNHKSDANIEKVTKQLIMPVATLGTKRVPKRYQNGTINICKSRLEVHLAYTF